MARWFEYRRRIERIVPEPSPRERFREVESRLQPPAARRPIGYAPGRGGVFAEPAYDLSDFPPRYRTPENQPPYIGVDPLGRPVPPSALQTIIPPEAYQGTDIPSQPFGREAEIAANRRRLLLREGGPSGLRSLPIDFPGQYQVVRDAPALAPRPGEPVIPVPGSTDVLLQRSYGDAISPTTSRVAETVMNALDASAFLSGRGVQSIIEGPGGAAFGITGGVGDVEKALSPKDFELAYEGAFRRGEEREDFERAVEELGFGYMFVGGILQPDLLIPGWGFTKADDVGKAVNAFVRAGRSATGESAVQRVVRESAEGAHLLENMRLTDITLRGGGDVGGARLADIAAPAAADITERTVPTARELAGIPVGRAAATETSLATEPVQVTATGPEGISFTDDVRGYHHGQTDGTTVARDADGKYLGHADWALDDEELLIENIEVAEGARRQGVGSALAERLRNDAPNGNINWGMTTPEGTALREAVEGGERVAVSDLAPLREYPTRPSRTLVDDVRANGVRDPISVSVDPNSGRAVVTDGAHRLNAAIEAGIDDVPVRFRVEELNENVSGVEVPGLLERARGGTTDLARDADRLAGELGMTVSERPRAPRANGTTYDATVEGGKVEYHIPDDNSELYIVNIGVEQERQGLGTRLIDYIEQVAQERNIPRITASLNTEAGVRVTNKLPNARYFDDGFNEVTFDQAIDLARAHKGPQLEASVTRPSLAEPERLTPRRTEVYTFVSPNTGDLTLEQAVAARAGPESGLADQFLRYVEEDIGIQSTETRHSLGFWQGGAEHSLYRRGSYETPQEAQYVAAIAGKKNNQYSVMVFQPAKNVAERRTAPHTLYSIKTSAPEGELQAVADRALGAGLGGGTIVDDADGTLRLLVVSNDEFFTSPQAIDDIARAVDGEVSVLKGTDYSLGGETLEAARASYDRAISAYESTLEGRARVGRRLNDPRLREAVGLEPIPIEQRFAEAFPPAPSALEPAQQRRLFGGRQGPQAVQIPTKGEIDGFLRLAEEAGAIRWYDDAIRVLRGHYGDDAEVVASLIAATSPRAAVQRNVDVALQAYDLWVQSGRTIGADELYELTPKGYMLPAHRQNVDRALKGLLPGEGDKVKVWNFIGNILGDQQAVTVDTWAGKLFGVDAQQLRDPAAYRVIRDWFQDEAAKRGLDPRELQARLWTGAKLADSQKADVRSLAEVIDDAVARRRPDTDIARETPVAAMARGEEFTPGETIRITGGPHEGKLGEIAGEATELGSYPVRIGDDTTNLQPQFIERGAAEQAETVPSTLPTERTPPPTRRHVPYPPSREEVAAIRAGETSVATEPVEEASRAVEATTEVSPVPERVEGARRAGRLAGLDEGEADEFARLLDQETLTPQETKRLQDLEERVAAVGSPPPPKTPDIPSGIAEPPGESGMQFVAPLRPLQDVVDEVVTIAGKFKETLTRASGLSLINPSLLENTEIGRALVAWERQRVAIDELVKISAAAATDPYMMPFTGRSPFRIGSTARVSGVKIPEGMSDVWMDIFSRHKSYNLSPKQRGMVEDFIQVVEETEMMRRAAGLKPRQLHQSLEDVFYIPRQVVNLKGVDLARPSKPGLQRYYEEAAEGVAKGVRYDREPRHVLELHLRAAYREILESQMDDVVTPLGVTARQFLERTKPGVVGAVERAVKDYKAIRRQVRREVNQAMKDLARPARTEGEIARRKADLARLEALRSTRGDRISAVKARLERAKDIYRREMAAAQHKEVMPGSIFGKAEEAIPVGQWRGKYFPLEDKERLTEAMAGFARTTEGQNLIEKGFQSLGDQMRFLAAVGDFAAPFIHGQTILAENPVVWARATARHYYAFLDPTIQGRFIKKHIKAFQTMAQHGTPIGDPEFFAALERGRGLSPGKVLEILPGGEEARRLAQVGGRQTFGRFQASYNTFLGDSRALLTEAMTGQASNAEVQAYIRNITGGLNSRALGVGPGQRGVESTWLAFSPRLARSTVALIGDAAKLGTTWRSRKALRNLATLAAGATGIYIVTGLALGKSWDEITNGLNPLQGKRFLSHEVNGDWIGVGGQVRAIAQIVAKGGQAIYEGDPEILFDPSSDNPLVQGALSRGAPGLRVAQATGEFLTGANLLDFENIDSLPDLVKFYATSSLPFAVQGKLEGEQWLTTGFGLIGARTSAETVFERRNKMRDQVTRELFENDPRNPVTEYAKASIAQKDKVNADPRVEELVEEAKDTLEAGGGAFGEQVTETRFQSEIIDELTNTGKIGEERHLTVPISTTDAAFLAGEIDVSEWRDREREYQTVLRTLRAVGRLRLEYPDRETQNKVDPYLDAYFEVLPTNPEYVDQRTGEVDWESYFRDKDRAYDAAVRVGGAVVADFLRPDSDREVKNMERVARDAFNGLPSRWEGTSPEDAKRLEEFSRAVEDLREELATEGVNGQRFSVRENTIATWLAEQPEWNDPDLAKSFIFLQSKANRQKFTNPAYDRYLQRPEHEEELKLFFPWLYGPSFYERVGQLNEYQSGFTPIEPIQRLERPYQTLEEIARAEFEEGVLEELTR